MTLTNSTFTPPAGPAGTGIPGLDKIMADDPAYFEQALTPVEVSRVTGLSVAALAMMRSRGGGPAFVKLPIKCVDKRGRNRGGVRYLRRDVIEWLYVRRVRNTAERVG